MSIRGSSNEADMVARVYEELTRIAAGYLAQERNSISLQPAELVHEAYLRLSRDGSGPWTDRAHFLAIGATAMRRILVERARAKAAKKRGGGEVLIKLRGDEPGNQTEPLGLLPLHAALEKLAESELRQAQVAELRFFAGMTVREVASVLKVSERTVKGDWRMARIWLHRELGGA